MRVRDPYSEISEYEKLPDPFQIIHNENLQTTGRYDDFTLFLSLDRVLESVYTDHVNIGPSSNIN